MDSVIRYSLIFFVLYMPAHGMEQVSNNNNAINRGDYESPVAADVVSNDSSFFEYDEDEIQALTFEFFERYNRSVKKFSDIDEIYSQGVDLFLHKNQKQLDLPSLKRFCEQEKKRLMEIFASIDIVRMQDVGNSAFVDAFLKTIACLPEHNQENAFALINEIENKRDMYHIVRESICKGNAGSFMQQIAVGVISLNWTFNGSSLLRQASHLASEKHQHADLIQALYETGKFDINEQDGLLGETALHVASRFCNPNLVNYLLTLKIKINITNVMGLTPLDCALMSEMVDPKKRQVVISLLQKAGAVSSLPLTLDSNSIEFLSDPVPQPAGKSLGKDGKQEEDGKDEQDWVMVSKGKEHLPRSSDVMNIVDLITSENNNNASFSNNNSNNSNTNAHLSEKPRGRDFKQVKLVSVDNKGKQTVIEPVTLSWYMVNRDYSTVEKKLADIHVLDTGDLNYAMSIAEEDGLSEVWQQIWDELSKRAQLEVQSNRSEKTSVSKRLDFGE